MKIGDVASGEGFWAAGKQFFAGILTDLKEKLRRPGGQKARRLGMLTFFKQALELVELMIVFNKLWNTMRKKGVSQYRLIKDFGISTGQLDRLRKNENVSTFTLNQLCRILDCKLEDIAEYIRDSD